MNFLRLVWRASTLLALNFFATTIPVEADYPALMVYCGFSVLGPFVPFDHVGRAIPFFFRRDGNLCYACPPTNEYERKVNDRSKSQRVLFMREMAVSSLHLDQPMPKCESRVLPIIRKIRDRGNFEEYGVGFQGFRLFEHVNIEGINENRDLTFDKFITIYSDETNNGQTISATNSIIVQSFLPTASNNKTNLEYENNENILQKNLRSLYRHFRENILPVMRDESEKNPFAHELGIEKLQLAPKDDYALDTWKVVSYLDINTTPIWRVLIIKWNAVEILVRKIGKMLADINVETGITGTLDFVARYYNEYDAVTKSELSLQLPMYLWKILTINGSDSMAGIVIIMHNDPFTESQKPLCEDICASNGWFVSNNDYRTGLIYCCEVTEEITSQLNSKDRQAYKILNLARFDFYGTNDFSKFLLGMHKDVVYDW